ncbi:MAG: hypothetical protein WBO10_03575 [Pyrinomonadaceae bacterium]
MRFPVASFQLSVSRVLCTSFAVLVLSVSVSTQWIKQDVETATSFRGLSVVNEKVIWASGTAGTVIRTTDAGKTWKVFAVPGAEKLDFRDIEAFDANTAYILSIGNGDSSRVYKTTDGGETWKLQFQNDSETAFFDAIACWDKSNCLAMSDPVDGAFLLISTANGGDKWEQVVTSKKPATIDGEAAFAASGTCLMTLGKTNAFIVSGGKDARVFRSSDRGKTWDVVKAPIISGTSGSGIFSIAMHDSKNGVAVGGNYEIPKDSKGSLAFTDDGGATWTAGKGLGGYRSGVAYVDAQTIIAVGTNGSDRSLDGGKTWESLDNLNYNSVQAKGKKAIWAVGPKGWVAVLK